MGRSVTLVRVVALVPWLSAHGCAEGAPVTAGGTNAGGGQVSTATVADAAAGGADGARSPTSPQGGPAWWESHAGTAGEGGSAVDVGARADAGGEPGDAAHDGAAHADAALGGGSTLCMPGAGSTTVNATIVVRAGETFDGQCMRYVAGPAVGDGSQSEDQKPVFRLEQGASLRHVVLGAPAADGIHTYGDATLFDVTWEDIGEDALTIKAPGTVELDLGAAFDGEDKVFQINAESTFRLSRFRADGAGKLIRQNGGTTFAVHVFIDDCDISNMDEAIFRTDGPESTVTMRNTRFSQIGDGGDDLWYGVAAGNVTESGNVEY